MDSRRKKKKYRVDKEKVAVLIFIFLLGFVMIRSDIKMDRYQKRVDTLEKKNNHFDQERESYEAKIGEMEQKVSELESVKAKNQELESIFTEKGVKVPLKEEDKVVFLTFDDGPSNLTPEFLKVLSDYGVHGTFFVTYQPDYESTYKQIIEQGNAIQIHTASHDYEAIYSSLDAYIADFTQVYDYVSSVTGKKPGYFRFPGGSTNGYGKEIVKEIARTMKGKGYDFVDWNVSVGDGSASVTRDSIVQKVAAESEGKQHVVLLAHDSATKAETLAALPQVIEYYKNNGYDFRVIDGNVDMSFAQFIDY